MPRHAYVTVDVFTHERFGGNPLAVFPEADAIDPALMPRIARELNLSETTFVTPTTRAGCDVRVRIFTPEEELAMAGHPTLGTAFVLGRDRVVFEEGVGPVPVQRDGDRWWMTQPAPRFESVGDARAQVAAAVGLTESDLADLPVEVGSSGNPFLYVPLASVEALGRAFIDGSFRRLSDDIRKVGKVYLFVVGEPVRARMLWDLGEDAATGSACGPLGGYLARHGRGGSTTVLQGVEMGRPSTLLIQAAGPGEPVRVGGGVVPVGGGWMEL